MCPPDCGLFGFAGESSGIMATAASGGKGPKRPNNLAGTPSGRVDPLPRGSGNGFGGGEGSCLGGSGLAAGLGAAVMGTSLGGAGRRGKGA